MPKMMEITLEELNKRVCKLERHNEEELLTLIEILSNASFFGDIKKSNCAFAKNGQCGFFILGSKASSKAKKGIPLVTECKIARCVEPKTHYHLELSNVTCAFCQQVCGNQPEKENKS